MLALQISDIGKFMNELLKGSMMDNWLLKEAVITQAVSFNIDGSLNHEFYSEEERENLGLDGLKYMPFAQLKNTCFDLIKGKQKPTAFKFVFLLSPKNQESTIAHSGSSFKSEDVTGMFMNFIYKNDTLLCTTGISYRIFSIDKSLEKEWDRMVTLYLKKFGIAAESTV